MLATFCFIPFISTGLLALLDYLFLWHKKLGDWNSFCPEDYHWKSELSAESCIPSKKYIMCSVTRQAMWLDAKSDNVIPQAPAVKGLYHQHYYKALSFGGTSRGQQQGARLLEITSESYWCRKQTALNNLKTFFLPLCSLMRINNWCQKESRLSVSREDKYLSQPKITAEKL